MVPKNTCSYRICELMIFNWWLLPVCIILDDLVVNLSSGMTFYCSLGLIVMVLVLVRFSLETSVTLLVTSTSVKMPGQICSHASEQGPLCVSEGRDCMTSFHYILLLLHRFRVFDCMQLVFFLQLCSAVLLLD